MTDEERRKKLLDQLRLAALYREPGFSFCDKAADEIERLVQERDSALAALRTTQKQYEEMGEMTLKAEKAALAQSDAEPAAADYIPIGGAGNGA